MSQDLLVYQNECFVYEKSEENWSTSLFLARIILFFYSLRLGAFFNFEAHSLFPFHKSYKWVVDLRMSSEGFPWALGVCQKPQESKEFLAKIAKFIAQGGPQPKRDIVDT